MKVDENLDYNNQQPFLNFFQFLKLQCIIAADSWSVHVVYTNKSDLLIYKNGGYLCLFTHYFIVNYSDTCTTLIGIL